MNDLAEIIEDDHGFCTLRRNQRVCDFFNREAIFFNHQEMTPDDHYPVILMKNAVIEAYSLRSGNVAGSMGAFTYVYTERGMSELSFGRYCSIASDVVAFGERHPLEWVTTSNVTYAFSKAHFDRAHRELMGSRWSPLDFPPVRPAAIIEHDVWIGQGAYLARGIRIGTGAVVAAGAVVTKDVAPYMIVGGNPARPIRRRFDDDIAERLLASCWWDSHPDCLFSFSRDDPAQFLDQLAAGRASGAIGEARIASFTYEGILAGIAAMESRSA